MNSIRLISIRLNSATMKSPLSQIGRTVMNLKPHLNMTRWMLVLLASFILSACGSGSGEKTELNPPAYDPEDANIVGGASYDGPASESNDVTNFKINLWDNLTQAGRCAACHNSEAALNQSPRFADTANINDAYRAALSLVNLDDPAQSRLATKVADSHNCWLSPASPPSVCAGLITAWISNWASGSASATTEIDLRAPVIRDVSATKAFPEAPGAYSSTVYPLLTEYCSRCHVEGMQTPYIGSSDINVSYAAAQNRINLMTPNLSRLVERLRNDFHNCWDGSCPTAANEMQAAITAFATPIPVDSVDPALVISKALRLTQEGILANSGGRFEDDVIAKYEFNIGIDGDTAYDTSGLVPAIDLNLEGSYEWVGGWGIRFGTGGRAWAQTSDSRRLYNQITATGEYSIEAWVVPGNVTQENAHIISYAGSETNRNFTLGQTLYNYDMFHRTSTSDQSEAVSTPDADQALQATLQHVVVTYTPADGRRIFVNGRLASEDDPDAPGTFSNWNNSFGLVMGSAPGGASRWQGTIRMAAIHNRALTAEQITQNHSVGVGEKYYMLFSVSELINQPDSYILFEVSQFDSYSYLFTAPVFVSLRDNASGLTNIPIQGMQIGINGDLPPNGQAYKNLDFMLNRPDYTAQTFVPLSTSGTILPLERGPDLDEMFLSFENINGHENVIVEAIPPSPPEPEDGAPVSDIGLKTFDEINASMSMITGIPKTNTAVANTFNTVRQQLPTVEKIDGFVSAHQMGITQLAIQYCDELVDDTSARATYFSGFNFNVSAHSAFDTDNRARIINPLLARGLGTALTSQPADADVSEELNDLITELLTCEIEGDENDAGCINTTARTANVVKATCAAVLGSAAMLVQ